MKNSIDHVMKTATTADKMTNRDTVVFHAFNPNGLVQRKSANDERIADLVNAGTVASGYHLAYGTFADFERNRIFDLLELKKIGTIKMQVVVEMLSDHCEKVDGIIAEFA